MKIFLRVLFFILFFIGTKTFFLYKGVNFFRTPDRQVWVQLPFSFWSSLQSENEPLVLASHSPLVEGDGSKLFLWLEGVARSLNPQAWASAEFWWEPLSYQGMMSWQSSRVRAPARVLDVTNPRLSYCLETEEGCLPLLRRKATDQILPVKSSTEYFPSLYGFTKRICDPESEACSSWQITSTSRDLFLSQGVTAPGPQDEWNEKIGLFIPRESPPFSAREIQELFFQMQYNLKVPLSPMLNLLRSSWNLEGLRQDALLRYFQLCRLFGKSRVPEESLNEALNGALSDYEPYVYKEALLCAEKMNYKGPFVGALERAIGHFKRKSCMSQTDDISLRYPNRFCEAIETNPSDYEKVNILNLLYYGRRTFLYGGRASSKQWVVEAARSPYAVYVSHVFARMLILRSDPANYTDVRNSAINAERVNSLFALHVFEYEDPAGLKSWAEDFQKSPEAQGSAGEPMFHLLARLKKNLKMVK